MKICIQIAFFFSFLSSAIAQDLGERMSKTLTLPNGLGVVLVSDPALAKSSMNLLVRIGKFADPKEHKGLAHLLEHVLNAGSQKYQGADAFGNFVNAHDGNKNAVTYSSGEMTGYWFEVNHQGLEGALERFASGISDPVWDEDFILREKNAVNSEFVQNSSSTTWQFLKVLSNSWAIKRGDLSGNSETLKNLGLKETKQFFDTYYSANQMKLLLLSNNSLSKLEELARNYFSSIRNTNRPVSVYDKQHFDPKRLPQFYKIQTIKKTNLLRVVFEIPDLFAFWESKPQTILQHLLERQDEGSLQDRLKKANLATNLSAGCLFSSYGMQSTNNLFEVVFHLTEEGTIEIPKVLEHFFAYVHFLQKTGYTQEYFQELQSKFANDYRFLEFTTDIFDNFDRLAPAFVAPLNSIFEIPHLLKTSSPEHFQILLAKISPRKMSAYFLSQDVVGKELDETYKTPITREGFSSQELSRWESAEEHFAPVAKNEFVTTHLEAAKDTDVQPAELLIDQPWIKVWKKIDHSYKKPEGQATIDLILPKVNATPRDMLMAWVAEYAFLRVYNTFLWKLSNTGLHIDAESLDGRFTIFFDGYNQKMPQAIIEFFKNFKNLGEKLDEQTFAHIKRDLKKNFYNQEFQNCFDNLGYINSEMQLTARIHWSSVYSSKNKVDLISGLTLVEFKNYWKELFAEIAVQGLIFGDLDSEAMKSSILSVGEIFHSKPLKVGDYTKIQIQQFPEGKPLARLVETNTDNQCWCRTVQFGAYTSKKDAAIRLGEMLLSSRFHAELRTQQQLGYILGRTHRVFKDSLYEVYYIQSDKYSPLKLEKQSTEWLQGFLNNAEMLLTDALFTKLKSNLITSLRQRPATLKDQATRIRYQALELNGDFEYDERTAKAVEGLTREEFLQIYRDAHHPEKVRSLDVFMHNEKTPHTFVEKLEYVTDPSELKRKHPFY